MIVSTTHRLEMVSMLRQMTGVSIIANPSVPALYEDALVYETGSAMTSSGALSAYSGAKTGRSPSDKRIVKEER
jgi:phosphoenolpyruvate carboxykinase (ATP)